MGAPVSREIQLSVLLHSSLPPMHWHSTLLRTSAASALNRTLTQHSAIYPGDFDLLCQIYYTSGVFAQKWVEDTALDKITQPRSK